MARAASHITELVDDVLDLSRIEAGSLPLRLSDVDVEPLLREVRDIVEPVARERSVSVDVVPGSAVVRADPRRLRQVLINLLTNAAIHNTAGGHARLETSQDGADVAISLTDDGPGIPRERLDRLFVPFERLGADDRDVPGAGLGLPLALALTEAMSGTLVVDTAVGRGTTVTVRLPASGSAADLVRNVPL
jgi:signal transduction histidine kinase